MGDAEYERLIEKNEQIDTLRDSVLITRDGNVSRQVAAIEQRMMFSTPPALSHVSQRNRRRSRSTNDLNALKNSPKQDDELLSLATNGREFLSPSLIGKDKNRALTAAPQRQISKYYRKAPTIPVPFKLTQVRKKDPPPEGKKYVFKAKPATVLQKQPFVPVLDTSHVIKTCPFRLSLEKRASERKIFNQHIREKELEAARQQEQDKVIRLAKEKRNVAKLRWKSVFHAQPIRHYAPMKIKTSRSESSDSDKSEDAK